MSTTSRRSIMLASLFLTAVSILFLFLNRNTAQQTPGPDPSEKLITSGANNAFAFASMPAEIKQKIQVALLLDVSNSMDGLIEQAKSQLWSMVNILGKTQCRGGTPDIEIALYEYGRSSNDRGRGYVKQVSSFTNDLDEVSKQLFSLTTNGGDEYCGKVIYTSLDELMWDTSSYHYKVIFIAGNEDFLQGDLHYTVACKKAKEKGVIVNTIYCGSRENAIRENWNLGAECGNGSFTVINHNAVEEQIPTPYDQELVQLNGGFNRTIIAYGNAGSARMQKMEEVDGLNEVVVTGYMKRVKTKANKNVYKNTTWDLVDAYEADSTIINNSRNAGLPDSLRNLKPAELKVYVEKKKEERAAISRRINELSELREQYILEEKKKKANAAENTLETEIEKILKEQVKRFRMSIP